MGSLKYLAVLALVASVLAPAIAAAANDVNVVVIDKNGDPIKSVSVKLLNTNGSIVDSGTTDSKGKVKLNADDGKYKITATHKDYQNFQNNDVLEDLDNDIDVVVIMRPKIVDLTIHVVDDSGKDIADVKVKIESLDEDLNKDSFDNYDPDDYAFAGPDGNDDYDAFNYEDTGKTNKDGEVRFDDVETDTKYNITLTKSGYTSKSVVAELGLGDDEIEIKFVKPGTAIFTAIVKDKDSGNLLKGITVTAESRETGERKTEVTNADGRASLTLNTPDCFDIAVEAPGYSTASQTNVCLKNDNSISQQFTISSENKPPVASAGPDKYALVGGEVTLDGSGSADPDEDRLTYKWVDSLGTSIPDGVTPVVAFSTAGDHIITLTVSDGTKSDDDEVIIHVEDPKNCGDGTCSAAELNLKSCPMDCPTCKDGICAKGEENPAASDYCPLDCEITLSLRMSNTTRLVAGSNATTLVAIDSASGKPVVGARMIVTTPNGSVLELTPVLGEANFVFDQPGVYKVGITSNDYVAYETSITVGAQADFGWIIWVVVVIVFVIAILFAIRFINMSRGAKGYRAKRFRRAKPTLSSV